MTTFETLLTSATPNLRRYARSLTHNASDAEDLVQDTLLRAWQAREQFQPGTNFAAWVSTILRHIFLDLRRRQRSVSALPIDAVSPERLSVKGQQELAHEIRDVQRGMTRLSREHLDVFINCGLLGHGYEEAADIIGVPVGTVRSRLSRAREEVRQHIEGSRLRFYRVST